MENKIVNADCFSIFPSLPKNSIDLILVDLPYGQTACDWDVRIDLDKMWEEIKRFLKPTGQVLFFTSTKFGYELIKSNEKWFRTDIVWEKNKAVGHLTSKKTLMKKHEMIYLFHRQNIQKGTKRVYNPQMIKGEPYSRGKIKNGGENTVIYSTQKPYTHENLTGDRFPTSVIKIDSIISGNGSKRIHATQKPVELCEWLIKTYSNENDLVLDFTMGSGSTIVACINTKRRYIGIEKDEEIFKSAEKRINERILS